jgi:hypothetical protein
MKLTIQKFQELYQISTMEIDEIDKSILLVACITNKKKEDIETMNIDKFNMLCKSINEKMNLEGIVNDNAKPKQYVRVKGRWYFLNYEIGKAPMNTGRYVEVATYSDDTIGNLHKIMATMATPLKWSWKGLVIDNKKNHKQISEDMLQLDFNVAYHAGVFFYALFTKSIKNSITYFTSISDKAQVQRLMQNLVGVLDGFITAKWYQNLKI